MNWNFFKNRVSKVERFTNGLMFFSLNKGKTDAYAGNNLNAMLTSPAMLKVVKLIADTGSMANINLYSKGKLKEVNFLYSVKKQPNPHQTWTQFIWDYFFYTCYGTAYYYYEFSDLSKDNNIYFLDPSKIEFKNDKKFSLIFDNKKTENETFFYAENGTKKTLSLKNLKIISNLTTKNGTETNTNLNALIKVINNSERALTSKSGNLDYSDQFFLTNKEKKDIHSFSNFDDKEKQTIINSLNFNQNRVHVTSANLELKKFVDNKDLINFDEVYLNDLKIIGNFFSVPNDILEALNTGSTYENQEKSMARFVNYVLQPIIQKLTDVIEQEHNFEDVRGEWTHLSFMNVFEKEKSDKKQIDLTNLKIAKELGLDDKIIKNELNKIYENQ